MIQYIIFYIISKFFKAFERCPEISEDDVSNFRYFGVAIGIFDIFVERGSTRTFDDITKNSFFIKILFI